MRFHFTAARRLSSRSLGRRAAGAVTLVAAGLPGIGLARTIKLPEVKPVVMFDVPDDWTMTPGDAGLELCAPDRTSVIVTGVVKRSKADLVAWQKKATQRMIEFGLKFDPNAKVPQKAANNGLGALIRPQAKPTAPAGDTSLFSVPSMTMLSQVAPEAVPSSAGQPPAKEAAGQPADKPAGAPAPLRFSSAVLYGASLAGKPVDVQFLNFAVGKETSFLMQQESGSTDDRAAAIVKSVRSAE